MLTKITLTNFQSHKTLDIECGNFTTLTGGSNGGKSAVLRAMLGLVRNDSVGDYVRHGQKSLSVKMEFDDGVAVEWIKGSGINKYVVTDEDGKQEYDKVGSDVPEEVRAILKLGPIAIKGSDKEYINFHPQLDTPFLISATPGSVAKLFGELTSASQLYTGVAEGNRRVRSTNALQKTRKSDLDTAKDDLQGNFADLDQQEALLETASNAFSEASTAQSVISALEAAQASLSDLEASESSLVDLVAELAPIDTLDLTDLVGVGRDCAYLEDVATELAKYDTFEEKADKNIAYLERATAVSLSDLEALTLDIGALESFIGKLEGANEAHEAHEGNIAGASALIESYQEQIDAKMEELEDCPECGETLSDDGKERLLSGRPAHAAH